MTPDEELVRRLLADARHDEPMPAEVVARLDGVLDDLATERRPVTPLRQRRDVRRRRWLTGLVAAAAVVVGGITLRTAWPSGTGMSDSSSAGSAAADSQELPGSAAAPRDDGLGSKTGEVAELHLATLQADVDRAVERLRTPVAELTPPLAPATSPFVCAAADWGPGRTAAVRLDGRNAMLVLRPRADGHQVADVLECGTARVLASARVPAR
jgi:hypothetical protein